MSDDIETIIVPVVKKMVFQFNKPVKLEFDPPGSDMEQNSEDATIEGFESE
jgi:hypothetical protein